jgi:hypothetical protein
MKIIQIMLYCEDLNNFKIDFIIQFVGLMNFTRKLPFNSTDHFFLALFSTSLSEYPLLKILIRINEKNQIFHFISPLKSKNQNLKFFNSFSLTEDDRRGQLDCIGDIMHLTSSTEYNGNIGNITFHQNGSVSSEVVIHTSKLWKFNFIFEELKIKSIKIE